ncbi:MAG TPA: DUF4268 domain-containing protein [Pyrinomonadaceae bacterium]|nr:DUF4268 domain-containing protein [Pyrinomonadaceae bacterium]
MAIFQITENGFNRLSETSFNAEKIYERKDLQRLLKSNVEALSSDLKVIAEEFGDWADSNRRIDLLCIDKDANLVVVEIKRTDDGGHMELQAIRYAAMVSTMTFKQLVEAHAKFLRSADAADGEAEKAILEFLEWSEPDEEIFAKEVRIILASADFSREITTSVMWLNRFGLDIRCVRFRPYRMENSTLLVDVQQIIPLPEASDYQTRIRAKEREGKEHRAERYDLRLQFWTGLLEYAKTRTSLHATRSPGKYSWIGGSTGKRGLSYNYAVREDDAQAELYIDFGTGSDDKNLQVFNQLASQKENIEQVFGGELQWEDLPEKRGCRIRKIVAGGYRSPSDEWPRIFEQLVSAMINLDKALRPHIQSLSV